MSDVERSGTYAAGDAPSGGQQQSDIELSRRRNGGGTVRKFMELARERGEELNRVRAECGRLAQEKAELEQQLRQQPKASPALITESSEEAEHNHAGTRGQIQEFCSADEKPETVVRMRNVGSNIIVTRTTSAKPPEYVKPPQTSDWLSEYAPHTTPQQKNDDDSDKDELQKDNAGSETGMFAVAVMMAVGMLGFAVFPFYGACYFLVGVLLPGSVPFSKDVQNTLVSAMGYSVAVGLTFVAMGGLIHVIWGKREE